MRTKSFWFWWHLLAGFILLVFPGLVFSSAPWLMHRTQLLQMAILIVGYAAAAAFIHVRQLRGRPVTALGALGAGLAGFVPPLLVLQAFGPALPVAQVGSVVAAAAILLSVPLMLSAPNGRLLLGLGGGILGGLGVSVFSSRTSGLRPGPTVELTTLATELYSVQLSYYRGLIPRSYSGVAEGGITPLGDGGLLVTGDGDPYYFSWSDDHLSAKALPFGTPMNRQALIKEVGTTAYIHYFRVLDVASRTRHGRLQVFVSQHYWRAEQKCFVVRVSMLDAASVDELLAAPPSSWRTIYDTRPCLALQTATDPGWPFRGMEGGGKMGFLDDDHLLLTVGDQGFNGVDFKTDFVDDPSASYGKTMLIPLEGGDATVFSTGHRNPEGLFIANRDSVWLTEHGPRGGDELNLIVQGGQYGWPKVTYGTDYGTTVWPPNQSQGRHLGYAPPVFAWVPSVGVSAIGRVSGRLFSLWTGDLLIGSLVGETLFRARITDGHLRFAEPIPIGERVRDLYMDRQGRITIWTDNYSFVVVTPRTMAFAACSGCHTTAPGTAGSIGPNLGGVVGRRVASVAGYDYSAALRSLGGKWTRERLDQFLSNPQSFAPGTKMLMASIPDSAFRKAIIDYLETGR